MLLIAYNAHTSYEMAGILTHVGIEDLSHIHLMLQVLFLFHVLLCCKAPLSYLLSPVLRSSLRWLYRFQKLIISGIKSSIL